MEYRGNFASATRVSVCRGYTTVNIRFDNETTNHVCDLTPSQARRFALEILERADENG